MMVRDVKILQVKGHTMTLTLGTMAYSPKDERISY